MLRLYYRHARNRIHTGILSNILLPKTDTSNTNDYSSAAGKKFTVPTVPYKLHKLTVPPSKTSEFTAEEARNWLNQMIIIRRMENTLATLYKAKKVRGFCHLCVGEEAVSVGICSHLTNNDSLITAYRCHGYVHLFGASTYHVIAELGGKETGNVRGKGGSMHMYAKNFYGGNGIVGAQIPLGTGIALATKLQKKDAVVVALYGDGASNQGQVFESFNIAKLWHLPVIFVCENNHYGMGTSTKRSSGSTDYYARGDYLPGVFADGMDLCTVRESIKFAIEHVKSGKGPIVLEMDTYRYFGHSLSDPGTSYRTREEVAAVRKTKDPVHMFKHLMVKLGILTEEQMKKMESDAKKQIGEDVKKMESDHILKDEELVFDLYMKPIEQDVRDLLPWRRLPTKNIGKRNEGKRP